MITQAKEYWNRLSNFRKNRNRCRDYTFGRQWNDPIEVDGIRMSEYEYILREGNVPLQNNLIRRIVRNVLGLFRERLPEIMKQEYGEELDTMAAENSLDEIFCRTMEEFLISGMAVHRKSIGVRNGRSGIWTDSVSPGSFFFNTDSRDIRGWDLNMVGQVHRVSFDEWCRAFVKTPADFERAARLFGNGEKKHTIMEVWTRLPLGLYVAHDTQRGYIRKMREEEWKSCGKPKPGKWILEEKWRFYFLTEQGDVIMEGDSPYIHGGHPFVIKCYPFLDGEIHSFVGDLIDQQRYTNRLITLYDWVIRASAKGVLLLPEGAVEPENLRDMANQWSRFNGVIVYKPDLTRPEPKQITGNNNNIGISELLEIQLKMMEDVSGVNGILQGNTSGGNVSGELYSRQTTNAMYSLSDLLESFRSFIHDCATKDQSLMTQNKGIGNHAESKK